MRNKRWTTIAWAWLLVGTLDIVAALANFYSKTGKNPLVVLKYIASAIFGKPALAGGNTMAVYGLLFHFGIALIWTLLFFLVYPNIKSLSRHRILTGIGYGIFIWLMMTRLVVPLSNATADDFSWKNALLDWTKVVADWKQAIVAALILIGAIGLPLSFIAHQYYAVRAKA